MRIRETFIAFMMLSVLAIADGFTVAVTSDPTGAVVQDSDSSQYKGFIESIQFDVTGTTTGTVSITAGDGELVFSNAVAITADTVYRPRYITHDANGTVLAGGTNEYAKFLLNTEKVTVTITEAGASEIPYVIRFKISNADK